MPRLFYHPFILSGCRQLAVYASRPLRESTHRRLAKTQTLAQISIGTWRYFLRISFFQIGIHEIEKKKTDWRHTLIIISFITSLKFYFLFVILQRFALGSYQITFLCNFVIKRNLWVVQISSGLHAKFYRNCFSWF